jgi:hypothetical protein
MEEAMILEQWTIGLIILAIPCGMFLWIMRG